ncbi:MAG: hypothetical protein ACRELF_16195, partial [Gemmataceae bacterium]
PRADITCAIPRREGQMVYMFLGGKQVKLDPAIPKVEVHTGVMCWVEGKYHTNARGQAVENGITITVEGIEPHVLQLVAREKNIGGQFSAETYTAPGGRLGEFGKPGDRKLHIDSRIPESPYYDHAGNGLQYRDNKSVTIFDQPTVDGVEVLDLNGAGDWTSMVGLSFCISDGGLIGLVYWVIKKNFGESAGYVVKAVNPVPAKIVQDCWTILSNDGYANPGQWLPLQAV